MARLVFLDTAKESLEQVQLYIATASGHADVARTFVAHLLQKCRELAAAPFPLGRPRLELRQDLRSLAVGSYVIFFRQSPELVEIVAVVEGHRDLTVFVDALPHV